MGDDRPATIFSTSSLKWKYIISFALYYCNFVSGSCLTFFSPLVLEFSGRFNASVDQVSRVFMIMGICHLSSALLGTVIFKFVNRQLGVLVLLSLTASSLFLIPSATNLTEFFVYSSLMGLGSGGYDTAQVAWIIDLWRDKSSPWILSQHFAGSLGTLAPPLILAYILPNRDSTGEVNIHIPFYIAGSMAVLMVVINTIIYFAFTNPDHYEPIKNNIQETAPIEKNSERESSSSSISNSSTKPSKREIYIIGLSCCVFGSCTALQACTKQFLPTYAHFSPVKLSTTEGAKVLFSLLLGFTIGRLVGILLVLKIRPHFILAGNLILLSIANTILLMWGGSSTTMLWVGSIMLGVGMSTVYPALYAFIEKYVHVTETVSGAVTVAGGLISSIYLLVIGNNVEANPEFLVYVNYVCISVCFIGFSLLFLITYMARSNVYIQL